MADELKTYAPKYPKVRRPSHNSSEKLAYEISIFDLHMAKLCWADETGHQNYDLKIATRLLHGAVDTFLQRVQGMPIKKIILPIGNDLLHIDTVVNTTTQGTFQDTDGRWQKAYTATKRAMVEVIEKCLEVAPVDVVVVAGNHDTQRTFYLGDCLESHFHKCPDVSVNNSPATRKYLRWGENLLGFTHGDENIARLPLTMASEA